MQTTRNPPQRTVYTLRTGMERVQLCYYYYRRGLNFHCNAMHSQVTHQKFADSRMHHTCKDGPDSLQSQSLEITVATVCCMGAAWV